VNPGAKGDPLRAGLHYAEEQPVRLDVAAIVAHGTRIRRRRLLTRASAVALACAVVPVAVVAATAGTSPASQASAGRDSAPSRNGAGGVSRPGLGGAGGSGYQGDHAASRDGSRTVGYQDASGGVPSAPGGPALLAGRQVQTRVGVSARLTHGTFDPINNLVGDSSKDGVWFWGLGRTAIKLFHLSRTGHLRAWTVLPKSEKLVVGSDSGFAVTASGVAWLGLNSTLVRFDTTSGKVRTWPIPAPRPNAYVQKYWPQPVRGQLEVQSLAVASNGDVAVADWGNASSTQVLDPATGHFSQVMMPSTSDMPQAVGFAGNGTLGVGWAHFGAPHVSGVVLLPVSGPVVNRKVTDPLGVTAYGATSLLVGASKPDVVSASGVVRPLVMPVASLGYTGSDTGPAALKGDRLASVIDGAILSFPANATSAGAARTRSVSYLLPRLKCPPEAPGGAAGSPTKTTSPAPTSCHLPVELLATDKGGDLWIVVATGNPDVVDLLVPR
jgi:hypothetical protein